ncbi:MAG: ATP-binding cassette domain-containing protein [Desulfurococcales archaeon]|jgi:branched-chain amino acid transport system ATP-binding protein|nr:ATP-binding cassette domain-containing protein [Desulfurococcales archaeon]
MSREVVLETRDIWKRFGGIIALRNINIKVFKGELLGIIGPNGSGKTTLFNIITGFLKPDKGRIILSGEDVTGFSPHEMVKRGVVRTFQLVKPFMGMNVLDNIRVALYMRHGLMSRVSEREIIGEAREILKMIGLSHREDVSADSLSHGEKKKLEIGRALALKPKILLLDEPTGGLTTAEIDDIIRLIKDIHENGTTVVVVEHNMRVIMNLSERLIALNSGVVIAEGDPKDVVSNPEVVKAYLGERFAVKSR